VSKREIDVTKFIELLGSLWSSKEKGISDYACNVFADKIATIDIILESLDKEKDKELIEELKVLREVLKRKGMALWLLQSDTLTNLAVKVGRRSKVISW